MHTDAVGRNNVKCRVWVSRRNVHQNAHKEPSSSSHRTAEYWGELASGDHPGGSPPPSEEGAWLCRKPPVFPLGPVTLLLKRYPVTGRELTQWGWREIKRNDDDLSRAGHSGVSRSGGHELNVGSNSNRVAIQDGERRGHGGSHPGGLVVTVVAVTACEMDSEQKSRPGRKGKEFHPGWAAATHWIFVDICSVFSGPA